MREQYQRYQTLSPCREPQFGKPGLYPTVGVKAASDSVMAMVWTLAYSDGELSVLDIAEVSGLALATVEDAASKLAAAQLLGPA